MCVEEVYDEMEPTDPCGREEWEPTHPCRCEEWEPTHPHQSTPDTATTRSASTWRTGRSRGERDGARADRVDAETQGVPVSALKAEQNFLEGEDRTRANFLRGQFCNSP